MKPDESISWLAAALFMLFFYSTTNAFMTFLPGPRVQDGRYATTVLLIAFTVIYPLILSWRLAYLAGRRKR